MGLIGSYITGSLLGQESLAGKLVVGSIANSILFGDNKQQNNGKKYEPRPAKKIIFSKQQQEKISVREMEQIAKYKDNIRKYFDTNYKKDGQIKIDVETIKADGLLSEGENAESLAKTMQDNFQKLRNFEPFKAIFTSKNFADYIELMGGVENAGKFMLQVAEANKGDDNKSYGILSINMDEMENLLIDIYKNSHQLQDVYNLYVLEGDTNFMFWDKMWDEIKEGIDEFDTPYIQWIKSNRIRAKKGARNIFFMNFDTDQYLSFRDILTFYLADEGLNHVGKEFEKDARMADHFNELSHG